MSRDNKQIVRTFFHSVVIAVLLIAAAAIVGHWRWAAGYGLGAMISLFSLVSLKVCVPVLFHERASRRSTGLLHIALVLKLPVYAGGLYIATRLGSQAAFAAFVGCTLVPCVITFETVVNACIQSDRGLRRALAMRTPIATAPAVEELSRRVAAIKAESHEPVGLSLRHRAVREGAR